MSLDFVIIPIIFNYEKYAFKIKSELNKITNKKINVEVDVDYSKLFTSRINKWKKLECNVVTIDEDFNETSYIIVRFYSKGSRPNTMYLQDFINLVESFDCETQEQNKETQEQNKETQEQQNKETQEQQNKETQEQQNKETQEQNKETQEQNKETQEQNKETQEQTESEGRCTLS
jgi:Mg-chelatase subunit ChlI